MTGKSKCNLLKSIRCQIARKNNIEFSTPECTFHGECKGTCPKCEAELRYLMNELEKIKKSGQRVAVAGIAAAMVATSAAGCAPKERDDFALVLPQEKKEEDTEIFATTGVLPAPEETDEEGLTGDVAYPDEEIDILTGDVADPDEVLEGKVLVEPFVPEIAEMDEEGALAALAEVRYRDLVNEWWSYLVEDGEGYGVYGVDHAEITVTFDENKTITAVRITAEPGENAEEDG